jgi:hypothetical protein
VRGGSRQCSTLKGNTPTATGALPPPGPCCPQRQHLQCRHGRIPQVMQSRYGSLAVLTLHYTKCPTCALTLAGAALVHTGAPVASVALTLLLTARTVPLKLLLTTRTVHLKWLDRVPKAQPKCLQSAPKVPFSAP